MVPYKPTFFCLARMLSWSSTLEEKTSNIPLKVGLSLWIRHQRVTPLNPPKWVKEQHSKFNVEMEIILIPFYNKGFFPYFWYYNNIQEVHCLFIFDNFVNLQAVPKWLKWRLHQTCPKPSSLSHPKSWQSKPSTMSSSLRNMWKIPS